MPSASCQIHFSLSHRPLCPEPGDSVLCTPGRMAMPWSYAPQGIRGRQSWSGMPTLQGQGACLTHFYFHSKWNRVENKCWNYWDNIICIKCPFELRDLVMFTKNVSFELVYILTTGTAYWCHSGMMLNSSIFSGSWVKCLLKCCRSWCFLQSGIMCSNWPGVSVRTAAHVCGQRLGLQGPPAPPARRPHEARLLPAGPVPPPASAPCPCGEGLLCLPSVSSSGATYSVTLSSAFTQNQDANKCRQPLNLTTSFRSRGSKPRGVNWPRWDSNWVCDFAVLKLCCLLNSRGVCQHMLSKACLFMCLSYFPNKIVSPLRAGFLCISSTTVVFYLVMN